MTIDQTTNNDGARLLLLGDTHGNVSRLQTVLAQSNGAQLLQLGDLGVGFDRNLDGKFATLSTQYPSFSFFAGNHDSPEVASRINGNLGRFGIIPPRIFPSSFFISGGFSVDRERRTIGINYWPNEELDREEMELAEQEYVEAAPAYLFTHEAPSRLTE